MPNIKQLHSFGFTLLELLVVIAILGILSAIGVGAFTSSQMKSRDSHRKTDLKNITTALEVYYNDNFGYPVSSAGAIKGCYSDPAFVDCVWGGAWTGKSNVLYMAVLPVDNTVYDYYYISADGKSYVLFARLENTKDPGVVLNGSDPGEYTGTDCGNSTTLCNYAVASGNATLPGVE